MNDIDDSNGNHIIQMCSGITHGRVLTGESVCTKISEVNLSAFIYKAFHEDFSSIIGINTAMIMSSLSLTPTPHPPKK